MTTGDGPLLTPATLPAIQRALAAAGVDGWLLYDFRHTNPVARVMAGLQGMGSRRIFAWVPTTGAPIGVSHAIEQLDWARWHSGWERRVYSSWPSLEEAVRALVAGKRVAMEYSPGDAVPVVDRVPAGVIEMVRNAGAEVVTSANLVSQFFAVWSADGKASHERAAELIARIAREAFDRAGKAARAPKPITEYELVEWMRGEFRNAGLETDHGPNVSATENAANPHYDPGPDTPPRPLRVGDSVLIDLWATEPGGIYADQTWMASIGEPSAQLVKVWTAVRDARDAALDLLRSRIASGTPVRGADADDAARRVIEKAGFGPYFTHRTGHSIDARALHGSGPNLDNLESRDDRLLIPGVGFSVEPGVYIPGEIGVRSEVNCHIGERELLITPRVIQRDLFIV